MAVFTSPRERRLWFWTLAVVVAIYSTLGLAGTFAEQLSETGLTTVGFAAGMFLVGVTVLTQGLRTKPSAAEIGVVLGVAVVYLMVFLRMALPERSHLIEYGIVASFVYEALMERSQGRRFFWFGLVAVLFSSLIGAVDEGIQLFLPSRVFDPVDMLFNGLASVMAISARIVVERARHRKTELPHGKRKI